MVSPPFTILLVSNKMKPDMINTNAADIASDSAGMPRKRFAIAATRNIQNPVKRKPPRKEKSLLLLSA